MALAKGDRYLRSIDSTAHGHLVQGSNSAEGIGIARNGTGRDGSGPNRDGAARVAAALARGLER
jgi:hypothetical protein